MILPGPELRNCYTLARIPFQFWLNRVTVLLLAIQSWYDRNIANGQVMHSMNTSPPKGTGPLPANIPNQGTILVLDNNKTDAEIISTYLVRANYNVHHKDSGSDIWEIIPRVSPDVIVLATDLPEVDSLAVCQQIKQDETLGFMPVIMIAAGEEDGQRLAGVRSGADEYLVRPVETREFLARIRALVSIRKRFNELLAANRQLTGDLAERNIQLEKALKTAEELDIIKSAIVRNVSHELRTPLLQVKSAIALLDEELEPETLSSKILSMATQAVGRLESTVGSITQLAESQNLKLEPVVLDESVDLAIRNLERSWKSHDDYKRIVKTYDQDIPLAQGDKRGIAQVLQVLLDNALKFSPGGGLIEVIITPLADERVWIGVRDHGIGIPKNKLDRIFESFYQVESSSTRRFSGVGVGLTLASFILDQLGSSIRVDSDPGKGSTFSFVLAQEHLPLEDDSDAEHEPVRRSRSVLPSETEDEDLDILQPAESLPVDEIQDPLL